MKKKIAIHVSGCLAMLMVISMGLKFTFPSASSTLTATTTKTADEFEPKIESRLGPFQIVLMEGEFKKWIQWCAEPGPKVKRFVKETASGSSPLMSIEQIYRRLQSEWRYKADPENEEWLQSSEWSVEVRFGDCEDYASCMASCLAHAGATVRLVCVRQEAGNHCYCEVLVGSVDDRVTFQVIDQLALNLGMSKIAYRNSDGKIWLALDMQPPTKNIYDGDLLSTIPIQEG